MKKSFYQLGQEPGTQMAYTSSPKLMEMPEEEEQFSTRAFTNRPELADMPSPGGATWEYRPEPETPPPGEITSTRPPLVPETGEGFVATPPQQQDIVSMKEPTQTDLPDYSAAGREKFMSAVKHQIGFDPITFDPYREVERAESQQLPQLFNRFFGGRVMWGDRDKLNTTQKKQWDDERLKFRAHVFNRAEDLKKMGMAVMDEAVENFDNRANEFNEQVKLVEKRMQDDIKTARQAPNMVGIVPAGSSRKTAHIWDPATRQYMDTGRPWAGATNAQLIQQMRYEDEILEGLGEGDRIDPATLESINSRRSVLDMPRLVEIEEEAPEVRSRLGRDWLARDKPGRYRYVDENMAEAEEVPTRSPVGRGKEEMAAEIEEEIVKAYPTAFKAVDDKWYYTDDNGQTYRIEVNQ